MSLVSFVKNRENQEYSAKESIGEALDLIGYSFKKDIKKIVIKANLCYYWDWTTGQTSDPRFTGALIDLLRERISPDVDISIVESDASAMKCKYAFKFLDYENLAKRYSVNLVNLSEDKYDDTEVRVRNNTYRFMVPRTIRDADFKINLPKIKYTFPRIKFTCALKNIYGCNPYPKKYKYHSRIEEVIVGLNKLMRFDLCIIDADIVSGVKPRKLGLTMASHDSVAIDAAGAKVAGINPRAIPYLPLAVKEGLGNIHFVEKGEPLDYFRALYPKKSLRYRLMGKAYALTVKTGLNKRLGLD